MRYLIRFLSFVLALAASPLQAQTVLMPPPWPQYFDLHGTNRAHYSLQVKNVGSVAVSAQWQGDPLMIVITKPNGQPVYVNANAPSMQAHADATVGDVAPGKVWNIDVYATLVKSSGPGHDPNANHNVKGSINVQVPSPRAVPVAAAAVGQAQLQPAPRPRPGPIPTDNGLTPDANPSCFAYAAGSGAPANVQCSSRRDWCEQYVRTHTTEGGTKYPNMVILLGCSPSPLYCYSYNSNSSGVCFASGEECVASRNNFASQNDASVGICRLYTGGRVTN